MTSVKISEPDRGLRRPIPRRGRPGFTVVTLLALAIAGYSLALYAQGSLSTLAARDAGLASAYVDAPAVVQMAFYVHVVSASAALLLGPGQFSRRLRRRALRVHRIIGRVYLATVALGAFTAVVMAPFNSAGMVGFFGFGGLVALWGYSALRGYRSIRDGDLLGHQSWMIRNYALTFAAPTLRIWLGLLIAVQVLVAGPDPDVEAMITNAYAAVPFLCWLPNIVVAEWLIRRRGLPSYQLVPAGT